jgi:hypothetical protein
MDMSSVLVPSFNNRAVIWFKRWKVMAGTACLPAAPQRCLTDSDKSKNARERVEKGGIRRPEARPRPFKGRSVARRSSGQPDPFRSGSVIAG